MSVIMKIPIPDGNLFKFVTVLNTELWIGIGLVVVATSLLLWIFDHFSPCPSTGTDSDSVVEVNEDKLELIFFLLCYIVLYHKYREAIMYCNVNLFF